ncbi:MAG: hypothetical protein UDR62_00735, partial [Lachnospiraceae bacterium]|nr:hypothetical protein [Lachnospiraceae bacterium]
PLQRKAERKTALSNWRKSKRFPRYIGKRMRTMLISLKTPIFLPICTGSYQQQIIRIFKSVIVIKKEAIASANNVREAVVFFDENIIDIICAAL